MKLITTIEFKSETEMFEKEELGIKNNTIRIVSKKEDELIQKNINNIKFIRIINTENVICTSSFVRSLKDISRFVYYIPDIPFEYHNSNIIYIFTWNE